MGGCGGVTVSEWSVWSCWIRVERRTQVVEPAELLLVLEVGLEAHHRQGLLLGAGEACVGSVVQMRGRGQIREGIHTYIHNDKHRHKKCKRLYSYSQPSVLRSASTPRSCFWGGGWWGRWLVR